ncbi:MAG TPA: NAD(P)-dependent oxidoreductase [Dehalococcoidia bacterium]|nr:NAD(P)-dependent oxidoreductase [Dehalococcoidia bacterium]
MKLVVVRSGIAIPEVQERHVEGVCAIAKEAGLEVARPATREDELIAEADAEIAFGGLRPDLYTYARQLRWVQTVGAGVDAYLKGKFVEDDAVLTSEKGAVGVHLAEHAFALLLTLTRGVAIAIRGRRWDTRIDIRKRSWELTGRTAGLVALGGTGVAIARRARAFDMRVIAVDPESAAPPAEVEACWGLDRFYDLLGQSDVVFVSAPLTARSRRMFDAAAFAAMKPDSVLINVSRGEIVDGDAVLTALDSGHVRAAGLDVTPEEPLPPESLLWDHPHVVVTPRTAVQP